MGEINLIPQNLRQVRDKSKRIKSAVIVIIIILILAFSILYIPMMYLSILNQKEERLKNSVDSQLETKKDIENEQYVDNLKQYIEKTELIKKQTSSIGEILKKVEGYILEDILVNNFKYENRKLTINASTSHYDSATECVSKIQENRDLSSVRIISIHHNHALNLYDFVIEIDY
jgi:hypothetical protein